MKYLKYILLISVFVFSFSINYSVFAANIIPTSNLSQFRDTDLNSDLLKDRINWNPTSGGATVSDSAVTGTIWGETVGWINLTPTSGGVTNTCSGVLGGTAWGQNTGWINFAPTGGGVTISTTTGEFSGWAWTQNYGWIRFDCGLGVNSCVKTTWTGCSTPPGGGGGGDNTDLCTNIDGIQTTVPVGYAKNPSDPTVAGICTTTNDVCPNISGQQTVVPTGYYLDVDGYCKVDYCPNLPGNQTSTALCPGQVNDVCPNITGNQTTIPTGYIINNTGECVQPINPPTDQCLNISGVQSTVPVGYIKDSSGNCIQPSTPNDICPNIAGNQNSLPVGYTFDTQGNCVPGIINPPSVDVCLNLVGDQSSVPAGYTTDGNGNCINPNPTDICPNLPGNQTFIPNGYMIDINGNCITQPYDSCPNIPGDQPVGTNCGTIVPPGNPPVSNIGSTTSIFSGKKVIPLITGLGIIGLVSTIPGIGMRIGNLILSIPFRRRRRPWGIVYDAETKEPLDPVYVTVYDAETNKVVDTKITDIHGRYAFLLPIGTYRITAQKTHYEFPSKKIPQAHSDGVYDDLYFGEVFSITNDHKDAVVVLNIPMDRTAEDWNQEEKKRTGIIDWFTRNTKLWSAISLFLFIAGFLFSIYALIISPNLWNKIVFILYIIFTVLQLVGLGPVTTGTITDQSGKGIPFAVIRVWNSHLKTQIAQRITNDQGQYYLLVPKGDYYITVDVKNASGGYDRVLTSENMHVKKGIINKSFQV